jgi:hypothetical protein
VKTLGKRAWAFRILLLWAMMIVVERGGSVVGNQADGEATQEQGKAYESPFR